jgi:hypothetical protein
MHGAEFLAGKGLEGKGTTTKHLFGINQHMQRVFLRGFSMYGLGVPGDLDEPASYSNHNYEK